MLTFGKCMTSVHSLITLKRAANARSRCTHIYTRIRIRMRTYKPTTPEDTGKQVHQSTHTHMHAHTHTNHSAKAARFKQLRASLALGDEVEVLDSWLRPEIDDSWLRPEIDMDPHTKPRSKSKARRPASSTVASRCVRKRWKMGGGCCCVLIMYRCGRWVAHIFLVDCIVMNRYIHIYIYTFRYAIRVIYIFITTTMLHIHHHDNVCLDGASHNSLDTLGAALHNRV